MADKKRKATPALRYFFIDNELHKRLKVDRSMDRIVAWNYPQEKTVALQWSMVRKHAGRAWKTGEVANMVNRSVASLMHYINIYKGIPAPYREYSLEQDKKYLRYRWSEKDILGLHDYMLTMHRGKPRLDGLITNQEMPSRAELIALLRHETMLYVKNDEGEFVPMFKEPNW